MLPSDQRDPAEFAFFVGYIVKQLNDRGSTANPAIIATRVFVCVLLK